MANWVGSWLFLCGALMCSLLAAALTPFENDRLKVVLIVLAVVFLVTAWVLILGFGL